MTTVYLLRHSKPLAKQFGTYDTNEMEQIKNEKRPLSVNGEKLAYEISKKEELSNIDVVYSSHYVRAISTAKYIAENNNLNINVDKRLGERKFGVKDMKYLPNDFCEKQIMDWDYKIGDGESSNEVSFRMNEALLDILTNYPNNNIAIVSHGTAISVMLKKWCDIKLNETTNLIEIYFKNNLIFNGDWRAPELFELRFDKNNNLINIENIR